MVRLAVLFLALVVAGERAFTQTTLLDTAQGVLSRSRRSTETVVLRGRPQLVHVYGTRGAGIPVIVSSGDGGWIHLAPHVAEVLAAKGYFVIGFDAKAYLKGFTSETSTLRTADVPADYRVLADYAAKGSASRPILIGVSEGAGLSVLAAAGPATKPVVGGVVVLGLPELNELGWRWKDSLIYVTHGVPNEPTFSAAPLVSTLAPIPLAAIHSTQDEFVPVSEIQQTMARASEPKRLWIVKASDHRFKDNTEELDRRLLEALEWETRIQPR